MLHVTCRPITQLWNRIITMHQWRLPLKVEVTLKGAKVHEKQYFGWVNSMKSIFQEFDLDITCNGINIHCCELSKNY